MAVPKKRTSKSKTQLRKTKWREKALAEAQNAISTLRRDPILLTKLREAAGQDKMGKDNPIEGVRKKLKAFAAEAKEAKPPRGFGSQRRQVAIQAEVEKQQPPDDINNNKDNN